MWQLNISGFAAKQGAEWLDVIYSLVNGRDLGYCKGGLPVFSKFMPWGYNGYNLDAY